MIATPVSTRTLRPSTKNEIIEDNTDAHNKVDESSLINSNNGVSYLVFLIYFSIIVGIIAFIVSLCTAYWEPKRQKLEYDAMILRRAERKRLDYELMNAEETIFFQRNNSFMED